MIFFKTSNKVFINPYHVTQCYLSDCGSGSALVHFCLNDGNCSCVKFQNIKEAEAEIDRFLKHCESEIQRIVNQKDRND